MPAVKFFTCLGVCAYLNLNKNPHFWMDTNEGKVYASAVLFLGEEFVRITEEDKGKMVNSYYDWNCISTIRTLSPKEGSGK